MWYTISFWLFIWKWVYHVDTWPNYRAYNLITNLLMGMGDVLQKIKTGILYANTAAISLGHNRIKILQKLQHITIINNDKMR